MNSGREIRGRTIELGIISMEVIFETLRLNKITQSLSVEGEEKGSRKEP